MNKEKEIAHINGRYLIIGALLALLGTFATIYFSERNSDEASQTKREVDKPEKENETSNLNQKQTTDRHSGAVQENPKKLKDENVAGVEVIITLKDEVSKEAIPDAVFSFNDYSIPLRTDKFGRITIPNKLIEKFGNFNTVRATIKKDGYQTEETNVALSESHSLFINKLK